MGFSGAVSWIAKITSRPIVQGLVLSLGLGFILTGIRMTEGDLLLAAVAVALTFFLLSFERVPAMLVLLALGVATAIYRDPTLVSELGRVSFRLRLPEFALTKIAWGDVATGVLVLGLPQVALTLGNAIITTVEENNTWFPDRPLTVKTVAVDHGAMNLIGTTIGGVPMCHGAGGLAGHVRFGARTGGALVILGVLVLFTGLFLGDSVATIFKCFPQSLLGVILLFGGLELASGVKGNDFKKEDRYVMILTAGLSLWNMGVGYVSGLILWYAFQGRWLRA
jgi:MFS superfamily sulfate permease-like transporter